MSLAGDTFCRVRSHIRSETQHVGVENQIDGRNPLGRVHFAALEISGTLLKAPEAWEPVNRLNQYYWYIMPKGQVIHVEEDWITDIAIQDEDRRNYVFCSS